LQQEKSGCGQILSGKSGIIQHSNEEKTKMKKQINPTIKAHLIRGAFYLLLLIAVCAIPFALAQSRSRGTTKSNAGSRLPNDVRTFPGRHAKLGEIPTLLTPTTGPKFRNLPQPKLPSVVLYDQYDNAGTNATSSQDFEAAFDPFDDFTADDFVVPAGQTWNVSEVDVQGTYDGFTGPALSFHVFFYQDSGGLPGTQVYAAMDQPYTTSNNIDFVINLSVPAVLSPGTYWVSVQCRMDFNVGGQWYFQDRTVQSNNGAAWENPGGGFGICQTWGRRGDPAGCNIDPGVPDQVYRLAGTIGGGTPTPTPTGTPPSPTPTATAAACSWSAGQDLPSAGTRFGGVFFPGNGKFYAMGGRDVTNTEFTHPFEYDPVGNSWTTKAASYPDSFVSNTECAVANDSGTDYIYCVGGSSFATQTSTGRVFRYDPVADVITTVATNWPPGDANVLPGGIAVFNNKIYILGGFNINTSVTDEIWQFTPNPAGWVKQSATLLAPRAYIPTTTIGNFIYTGGGADWDGTTLQDTTDSFKYDPVADTITTIASIPRATSNTRALNFCSQMYVMGGAFNAISNEVDIYDPGSDTWSIGTPFVTARRNSATDTDGTNNIWLAGGYDASVAIIASTEVFNCSVSPCGPSPTPTPTATATATPTPTGTPTPRATPTPRPRPTAPPRP
jgi:N-acetylneuraminic acid mutarotase